QDLGDSVADMSINLTKLTADIASLYNQDYADVAAEMQAIYTGMTRPLRKYGLDLTQATLKEWAMANGLDSNIEKMSQAEKTMLRYQYVMTRAAGAMGDFSKTADTWANSMRTVRQLLQEIARVIGEALINALRPALLAFKKFLFGFLEATESALNALGKLLGWKQIDFGGAALIDDTEGYADALDDAAGAAKKLKGQLRGIDELNNLTSNDKGGGGAGATGLLGIDTGSLWDSINDTERLYESSVEDFYDFGKRISTAIKNGLDSIDWESVYEKVGNFGRNLASFLNGLIQPDTFESIGKTIAGGLNTAFRFALEFGKEFDFRNVGVSLAEIINGFFRDFDFTQAAETINTWVEGFWDFVNGFFVGDENGEGGLDYNAITDGLTTFFKNLNWKSWVAILVPIFGKLTSSIIKIVSPILIKELTKKLSNPAVWTSLSSGLEKVFLFIFTRAFRVFEFAFDNVISPIIYSIFAFLSGYQIGNALGESIALLTGNYEEAQEYENASLMSILGVDMDLWEETWFEYFDDVRNKWDELIHNGSFLTIEEGAIDWSKLGFIDNPIEDFITNFNEATDSVEGFISVVSGSNNSDIGGVIDTVTEKVRTFREDTGKILEDWWNEDVAPVFDLPRWSGLVSTIKESINQVWTETVDFWVKEVPLWWDENVVPWFSKDRWDAMVESIFTSISEVWEDTKVEVNEFLEGWFDSLENDTFAKEHWLDIFSPIKEALSETFKAGVNLAVSALNALLKGIEDVLNFGGAAFNALIDLANAVSNKNLARWGNITIGEIPLPFANGGFPEVGSLFLAGEAGSEMVGTINGRSGVASNAEITGIADAIRSTSEIEIGLLRTQNALLQGILEKEFGISSDDVFRSVRTSAREFTRSTGRSAF
ncbi:MAG: hypothetical protein J6S49_01975, partial [Erysipelotrichaceae bacterium]|nr:hypothetical protein [Erysipelotrichaceae bacterium]